LKAKDIEDLAAITQ